MSVIFVEEVSRISEVYNIPTNNAYEIRKVIDRWNADYLSYPRAWYKDTKDFTFYLRADNLELNYSSIKDYVKTLGIIPQFTAVEQSSSNGLAERTIRTIDEMGRTMLLARSLPKDFWAWSYKHANFIRNRIPICINGIMCIDPYQAYFGHVFDYSKLRIFGSACWIREPIIRKSESVRGYRGIFIGFNPNSNAWLVYVPSRNKTMTSQDVKFDETCEDGLAVEPIVMENDSQPSPPPQVRDSSIPNNAQSINDLGDDAWMEQAMRNIADFLAAGTPQN
jgi:hypothetical protein